jgi:hypothetical protein
MNLHLMLELYRRAAVPFVADSVKLFKTMTQADQTELLLYMVMDNASSSKATEEKPQ